MREGWGFGERGRELEVRGRGRVGGGEERESAAVLGWRLVWQRLALRRCCWLLSLSVQFLLELQSCVFSTVKRFGRI